MENKKYVKVMFGTNSSADSSLNYKLDEVNMADHWNPKATNPEEMGGFNFSVEDKILRWLIRGDTIYDVKIPTDAEVIDCESVSAPHGVFRTNKIILTNPRKVTDEMAMEFYEKSNLPEKSYYKALAGLAIMGYRKTARKLIADRVNENNIEAVLTEIEDFITPRETNVTGNIEVYEEIMKILRNLSQK